MAAAGIKSSSVSKSSVKNSKRNNQQHHAWQISKGVAISIEQVMCIIS